jgi:hypothetical protein
MTGIHSQVLRSLALTDRASVHHAAPASAGAAEASAPASPSIPAHSAVADLLVHMSSMAS